MKKSLLLSAFAVWLCLLTGVAAQEILSLNSSITAPSISQYQVTTITISRETWNITVTLTANTGTRMTCTWGGGPAPIPIPPNPPVSANVGLSCSNGYTSTTAPTGFATGQAMVVALNKANLSTVSLEKRIYNQLVADGAFAASVTGAVQ